MALAPAIKNQMLDSIRTGSAITGGTLATFASLHTADPGTTGTSEVTGGSPAYARKSITWTAASGGDLDNSNTPLFDVPISTTVTHFGLWSAVSAGTFVGGGPLSANETFAAQGTYTLSDADVTL